MSEEAAALDVPDGLEAVGGVGGLDTRLAPDAESTALHGARETKAAGSDASFASGVNAAGGFVRNDSDKSASSHFPLSRAFSCAAQGIAFALRSQRNMKIHVGAGILAVALGFFFEIDAVAWLAVILCIGIVLATECLNTALESIVDLVSPHYSELARRAKDCAAGAVLLCALASLAVAAVVFLPRIANVFG